MQLNKQQRQTYCDTKIKKEGKNKETETKTNEDKQIDYTKKGRCKKEVNTN